jgi:hypothetical protein
MCLNTRALAGIVFFLFSVFCAAAASDAPSSLCNASESVVFSCSFSDRKTVSLCASSDLSDKVGYLKYRFGKSLASLALEYPTLSVPPGKAFKYLGTYFPKGGTTAVSFSRGAYRYSLFSTRTAYGDEYNASGIIVDKFGKRVTLLICSPGSISIEPSFYNLPMLGLPNAGTDISYISAEELMVSGMLSH